MKPVQKYVTLFSLYIAQSVPMSFFSTVLPVIMRTEKFSLSTITLLQLIKLPWALKFLWSPVIDFRASKETHYKRWIITSELFYAVTILAIAFLNFRVSFPAIIILMVIAIFFSATQDIASDALAIRILKKGEQPFGNSMQSMGSFLGTLVGSGLLLLLYAKTGWSFLMVVLAAFVLVAIIPLSIFVRKKNEGEAIAANRRIEISDVVTFFKIAGVGKWVLILALYYSGILGILALLKPWMVDLGFKIPEIAFMVGIFGTSCGTAGAFLAGFIVKRMGYYKSLLLFSGYVVVATLLFVITGLNGRSKPLLYLVIAVLWTAYSMASVVIYTISMTKVRQGKEGTDYSLQIVITHLSGILVALISGRLADKIGYEDFFFLEAIMATAVFILVFFLFKKERSQQ